jgi:hypothetical protein
MKLKTPLVQQRTVNHLCLITNNANKKINGENIIRIVLLSVAFFILFQISTKEQEQKHPPQR